MTVGFLDAIKRGVGPSLEGLGWSEPCWAQRDVQLRRKTGDSSQIVLFARTRGLLHSGFYIHLYWRSNSIDERWDLDLNSYCAAANVRRLLVLQQPTGAGGNGLNSYFHTF